ncbi:unnamed protein product [Gulo gulo]
MPTAF